MSIKEHDLGQVRGDINDSAATFTQAATRENINSGETGKIIFGKIKKHFADMTLSAFATIVNNATTTVANTVLDGRMGKILMDKINELNRNTLKVITATEKFTAIPGQSRDLEKVITIPSGVSVQTVWTNVNTGYARTINGTDRGYSISGTKLTVWFSLGSTDTVNRDVTIEVICLYK